MLKHQRSQTNLDIGVVLFGGRYGNVTGYANDPHQAPIDNALRVSAFSSGCVQDVLLVLSYQEDGHVNLLLTVVLLPQPAMPVCMLYKCGLGLCCLHAGLTVLPTVPLNVPQPGMPDDYLGPKITGPDGLPVEGNVQVGAWVDLSGLPS